MTINQKPSASEILRARINSKAKSKPKPPQPTDDPFALAVAKRLEQRGITSVPGLPQEDDPPAQWYDLAIESHRRHLEFEAERAARKQAEEEEQNKPRSTASLLATEISKAATGGSSVPALNSSEILRRALAGEYGTSEGRAE